MYDGYSASVADLVQAAEEHDAANGIGGSSSACVLDGAKEEFAAEELGGFAAGVHACHCFWVCVSGFGGDGESEIGKGYHGEAYRSSMDDQERIHIFAFPTSSLESSRWDAIERLRIGTGR